MDRHKEVQKSLLKNEIEVIKELEKSYEQALDDIDAVITKLLARKDTENLQAIIYQLKYQKALKKELGALLEVLHSRNFTTIEEYLKSCYENGHIGALYELQGQGVPLLIPLSQELMLTSIMTNSKLSAPLYNALGYNIDILKVDVMREISRGFAQGLSYSEIARNLKNKSDIDYNKALRIAKTEGHRIQNESAYNVQVNAVNLGADILKQWDATLDSRTRDSHQKLDGEVVKVHEKFSNGLMYPSDPNGTASEVINCRCSLLQRASWGLTDEEFTKMNGKTNKLQHFEDIDDYNKFKEAFWGWNK